MRVIKIESNNTQVGLSKNLQKTKNNSKVAEQPLQRLSFENYQALANVNFRGKSEFFNPNRTVPHIDYEEYKALTENTKIRYRKRYQSFYADPIIDKNEMFDSKAITMPLRTEEEMDEFIKISSIYNKYKEQPIICLGRSPKWFLNTSLWMEGGIDDYTFVAFSKYWYRPNFSNTKMTRYEDLAPNEKEVEAYKKYLKRIKADPKTIVEHMEKTGKKTVITDYVHSGKGMTSFLEIMADMADEAGILEQFSKSFEIVSIGSLDYMEIMDSDSDYISAPVVFMPEKLKPYRANVKQRFHNMDYKVFRSMLTNQNVNECRSTYYPHEAWTIYKPDMFKTGLIKDMKKVSEIRKKLKGWDQISHFTPAMFDFRNLLNFRILDSLNARKILKQVHRSKI